MSSGQFTDDFKLIEDSESIVIKYQHAKDLFDLVYNKSKDKVLLIKNGKLCNGMRYDEKVKYQEILDIAINYQHDRDGELIH